MAPGRHRISMRRQARIKLRQFYDKLGRVHERCICYPYGDNDGSAHFPLCPKSIIPRL